MKIYRHVITFTYLTEEPAITGAIFEPIAYVASQLDGVIDGITETGPTSSLLVPEMPGDDGDFDAWVEEHVSPHLKEK